MELRVIKPFWESKRFWWNVGAVILAVVQSLTGTGVIPEEVMAVVGALGNVVLNQKSDGARLTAGARQ